MKIKLVKSLNGRKKDQIATAYSLGLKKSVTRQYSLITRPPVARLPRFLTSLR